MRSRDEESPVDVADVPDAQQLWQLLVTATGGREQAPSVAIDTFRRLHDAGQPEPVDSALLLCTDWRWRRTSARVLTGILARTPLAVPLTGRARVPWRLPRTAQRARTGVLVRAVSLRANAGPETSHG